MWRPVGPVGWGSIRREQRPFVQAVGSAGPRWDSRGARDTVLPT
jgi:hypothetical protein